MTRAPRTRAAVLPTLARGGPPRSHPGDRAVGVLNPLLVEEEIRVRAEAIGEMGVEGREEELVLACEVRVHGALRVAGLVGDLVEGGGVEAASLEDGPRGLDELRPCPALPFASRQSLRHVETDGTLVPSVF